MSARRRAGWPRLDLRNRLIVANIGIVLGALTVTWLIGALIGPAAFRYASLLQGLITLGIAFVLVLTVSTVSSRSIGGSLGKLVNAASRVAAGDYSVRVPAQLAGRELDTVAAAFNEMAGKVQNVESTRQRMLADLSHEMATPLATLHAYLEGIEDGVIELDPEVLAALRGQVDRLTRLTDDIRAISAADEGRLGLSIAPLAVGDVISDAAEALRPAFAEKHVQLLAEPGATVLVDADHERLVQVLTNLLKNAVRHTPPGGEVRLRTEARRDCVVILVEDTGEGIGAEHLPHLFERFYRAHARSGGVGGSGIGLTISRAIVAAHHGSIAVHSAGVGRGTTVRVTLPRSAVQR